MRVGHRMARSILPQDIFRKLNWGVELNLKTHQLDGIKQKLLDELESFKLLDGYQTFSRLYAHGDMRLGYQIAKTLVPKEAFDALEWKECIPIHVDKIAQAVNLLKRASTQA